MATYTPEGKPHRLMEVMDPGGANFVSLAERMPGGTSAARKRKTYHTLAALLEDKLIAGVRAHYFLTQAGVDALQGLRAGHSVTIETPKAVRLYG